MSTQKGSKSVEIRATHRCTEVEPRNEESTRHTADFHTFTMEPLALTGLGDQGRRISKRKTTTPAQITKDLGYVEQQKASDAVEAEDKSVDTIAMSMGADLLLRETQSCS